LDPGQVSDAQALTLNASKPRIGLKGVHGLFGAREWWESIAQGKMPLVFLSGVVLRVYAAGQDEGEIDNTVDLKLSDGLGRSVGIYVSDSVDVRLFRLGHRVDVVYVFDELKEQPSRGGGVNCADIVLEMAVSLRPTE
jgi:hypothetical protein